MVGLQLAVGFDELFLDVVGAFQIEVYASLAVFDLAQLFLQLFQFAFEGLYGEHVEDGGNGTEDERDNC